MYLVEVIIRFLINTFVLMWRAGFKVSPKNAILISPLLMRELKEIRSSTKGWRPLPIGCKGSLVMGVAFLPSSFRILTLV